MPNFNKNDFSGNPVRLDCARSRFAMPFKHKTTFIAGKLIPIFSYGDVLPGDTFKIDMSCLVRMVTPVFPTMDDAYLDVYFFFTPHKLTLSRAMMSPAVDDSTRSWAAFIGAQDSLLNMPTPSEVLLPYLVTSKGNDDAELGSLTDYLGIGLGKGHAISCLEPLAYYSIWNNYFRDENTMNPVVYSVGSAGSSSNPDITGRAPIVFSGFDGTERWGHNGVFIGSKDSVLPVCRPHGYFGSALPWPQRNLTQVEIPLIGTADVYDRLGGKGVNGDPYHFAVATMAESQFLTAGSLDVYPSPARLSGNVQNDGKDVGLVTSGVSPLYSSGLVADFSTGSTISVNQLRFLVQQQRFYEALARGGNRIGELTASMFGVTPSDYAQDRPEYLGGKRIPISMDQVANTAGPNPNTQGQTQTLGSLGGYSNTGDSSFYFEKSFDTWGTITCVICVRTNETFSQGIARRYFRKSRFQFYWPQFANLGEQEILSKEIFVGSGYAETEQYVFGYQEAWAEYRYLPDIVSGYLRPDKSLGAYTYANYFQGAPTLLGYLNGEQIAANVDRTLVVPASTSGFQFIGDFSFNIIATRPMPRYSIPGLVDHH